MKVAEGINIKTEHILWLGGGLLVLYYAKQLIEGASEGATKGLAEGTAESLKKSLSQAVQGSQDFANVKTEQLIYNNPWLATAVGHPEWAYMTPVGGYF